MCGFIVVPTRERAVSQLMDLRGPDNQLSLRYGEYWIQHWLLAVNNCSVSQPVARESGCLVWNGQIYGTLAGAQSIRSEFPQGTDDTKFLSDLMLSERLTLDSFASKLEIIDGEFAICIVQEHDILIATDAFGTKPVSIAAVPSGGLAVATYGEDLTLLGLTPVRVNPGTALRYHEGSIETVLHSRFEFGRNRAARMDISDFRKELLAGIRTRCRTARRVPLIKLSGGIDSGTIAAFVAAEGLPAVFWSAPIGEDADVIDARTDILRSQGYEVKHIFLTPEEFEAEQEFVASHFPSYVVQAEEMRLNFPDARLSAIPGYVVGSAILRRAAAGGIISEISGQGVDEIFTDYLGGSGRMASTDGRLTDFSQEWMNFRLGWQQAFLAASERIAGLHGFETRYPFLAKPLVQSFLDLPVAERMHPEKAPLKMVLNDLQFPYAEKKTGFLGYLPDE